MRNPTIGRRDFLGLGVLLGAGAVAGCGVEPTVGASSTVGRRSKYTIEFWNSFTNSEQQSDWTEDYVTAWNDTHPNIQVNLVIKPVANFAQIQQIALAAGAGPDIVYQDGPTQVIPLAKAGQILALDKYAEKYSWKKLILPWAFATSTWDGSLRSLPSELETMVGYYNPATFDKYGWKPPTNLDETEALFEEAAGKGLQPLTAGNADFRPVNEWFVTMLWNHYAGPDALYQALSGKVKWTDPVFVESIELLQNWFRKGYIGVSAADYFTTHFDTCYANLASGKAAMYWSGTWELANLPSYFGPAAHNKEVWTWANLPQLRTGLPPIINELSISGTYSINAKSGDPDAVAQYLGWYFANRKAAAHGLKQLGIEPPPLPFTSSNWLPGTNSNDSRVYDQLTLTTQKGLVGYTTWTFWPPQSDTYIIQELDGVITGGTTARAYCEGLQSVFENELKLGLIPSLFKPASY